MNTSRLGKILTILAVTGLASGCKLAVMVNEGGSVQSSSGTHNCAEGALCTIKITDADYSETFTAVASPGYQFVKWNTGGGFLCANSTSPTCTVELSGDANSAAIVASFSAAYIMPVFKDVGFDFDGDGIRNELDDDIDGDGILNEDDICTANPDPECTINSLYINGKDWAQPIQFRGTTSSAISAVCPEGICNGVLTGSFMQEDLLVLWAYDLTGWTWAGPEAVQGLIDYYNGITPAFDCLELDQFLADGWLPWDANVPGLTGPTSSLLVTGVNGYAVGSWAGTFFNAPEYNICNAMLSSGPVDNTTTPTSGWFYRTP